jgi:MFS family permease
MAATKNVATTDADSAVSVPDRVMDDSDVKSSTAKCEENEASSVLVFIFCAVGALEGADVALLPSVLYALTQDLHMSLTDLGYAIVAQAVLQNAAAPIWGVLADRGTMKRKTILLIGSLMQGAITVLLALVTSFGPMIFLRGLNGAMLAALRPITNGMVADVTAETRQGKVFSRIQAAFLVGGMITAQVTIPISTEQVLGLQGWRVAFVVVGLFSIAVAGIVAFLLEEPPLLRHQGGNPVDQQQQTFVKVLLSEAKNLIAFFRMPTFCVMIIQGIFGTIPWTVMPMLTLFFQLSGLSNMEAALLGTIGQTSGVIGNLLGGIICDRLARRFGYHGRPLGAQISVSCGIPLMYITLWGIPPGSSFGIYAMLLAAFGFLATWCGAGVNIPILADIVPASSRSRVMAWEGALENSLANLLGPPIVTILSVHIFGYTFGASDEVATKDLSSAAALGKAMTFTICTPAVVCLCAYSMLHWSYPRDKTKLITAATPKQELELPNLMKQPEVLAKPKVVEEAEECNAETTL